MLSIIAFLLLCLCLGQLLRLTDPESLHGIVGHYLTFGLGLALIPVCGVFLDAVAIPLDVITFLLAGILIGTVSWYLDTRVPREPAVSRPVFVPLAVLALSITLLGLYLSGAFAYTYMEDGDSWLYTAVSKMIAENQTIRADYRYDHYSEPYTQGYQIILGLLHQTNDSIYWTVKVFNAVFAAMSLPLFYLLALEVFHRFEQRSMLALSSVVMMFAVPSGLTHHIYSMTLNAALLPLFLYALLRSTREWRWSLIAGVVLGSLILNHFFTAFVTIILFLFTLVLALIHGSLSLRTTLVTSALAAIIALIYYIPSAVIRHGHYSSNPTLESHGGAEMVVAWAQSHLGLVAAGLLSMALVIAVLPYLRNRLEARLGDKWPFWGLTALMTVIILILVLPAEPIVRVKGCCSEIYSLSDFLFPQAYNLMHNPIGWGLFYTAFVLVGVLAALVSLYKNGSKHGFAFFALIGLFLLSFLLVHGMRFSFGMMTFRMWTFMTVFSSLMAGYGLVQSVLFLKSRFGKRLSQVFVGVSLAGVAATSFAVKFQINTMVWPDHELHLDGSHTLHAWIRENLPKDSAVLNVCRDSRYLISYDMLPPIMDQRVTPVWREDHEPVIYELSGVLSASELADRLDALEIDYAVAGFSCMGEESQRADIVALIGKLRQSDRFTKIYSSETDLLFELQSANSQ